MKRWLLDVVGKVCDYTKGKPRHFEIWWWIKDVGFKDIDTRYQNNLNQITLNHLTLQNLVLQIFVALVRILLIVNLSLNEAALAFWLYVRQTWMAQLILAVSL